MKDTTKKVVSWKLTTSTSDDEIRHLLQGVKSRLTREPIYIILDDCCKSSNLYREIFGDVPIKLDVFHAIQRLAKCFPKAFPGRHWICNYLSLIVRQKDHYGEERLLDTAPKEEIMRNIEERMKHILESGLNILYCLFDVNIHIFLVHQQS